MYLLKADAEDIVIVTSTNGWVNCVYYPLPLSRCCGKMSEC